MASSKPALDEQGQVVVTLPYAGEKVTLRRPKGRDMKVVDLYSEAGEVTVMINLIACLADKEASWVEDLDAEDLGALGEALKLFPVFGKRR